MLRSLIVSIFHKNVMEKFKFLCFVLCFGSPSVANDYDGSGSSPFEEDNFVPTTKNEKAFLKLKQFIGIRGKVDDFTPDSEPPEHMLQLFDEISDPSMRNEDKNQFNADIIRAFTENNEKSESGVIRNVFNFDISGLQKGEEILEAELRLFRPGIPVYIPVYLVHKYLVKVYQVLQNRSLNEPDLHRLLNVQIFSIYLPYQWHVFNVKQAVGDWMNGAPNLGLLVTASTITENPMDIGYNRKQSDVNNSKQPVLILYNSDGKRKKVKPKTDFVTCQRPYITEKVSAEDDRTVNCPFQNNDKVRKKRQVQLEDDSTTLQNLDQFYDRPKHDKPMSFNSNRDRKFEDVEFGNGIVSRKRRLDDILKSMNAYERAIFRQKTRQDKKRKSRQPPKLITTHRSSRTRRSSEIGSSCAKTSLTVDFEAIGLGSRIIAPKTYEAYQCKGTCSFTNNQKREPTNHAFIQGLLRDMNLKIEIVEVSCVPTKLTNSAILYYDEYKNVVLKMFEDMIVKECECR